VVFPSTHSNLADAPPRPSKNEFFQERSSEKKYRAIEYLPQEQKITLPETKTVLENKMFSENKAFQENKMEFENKAENVMVQEEYVFSLECRRFP